MTIHRMVELLEIEHECMLRGAHDDCNRNCADCELVQDDGDLHEMYTNVIALLKEQKGLALALEQANATINYLNEEKEKTIKEIEERRAFNLKCDGQPEWLRKGIDVGLNTALDILKGKDGEQE